MALETMLRRKIKALVLDQYATVVDMQKGLADNSGNRGHRFASSDVALGPS
jgi:hypothetical protein